MNRTYVGAFGVIWGLRYMNRTYFGAFGATENRSPDVAGASNGSTALQ